MIKAELINKWYNITYPKIIVTVTQLPSGALETQVNTDQLDVKFKYILDNYDDELKMLRNPKVQIIGVIVA